MKKKNKGSKKRRIEAIQERKKRRKELENELFESDDEFCFIAGYTSGGAPFGIRWDEQEFYEDNDKDDDLPF